MPRPPRIADRERRPFPGYEDYYEITRRGHLFSKRLRRFIKPALSIAYSSEGKEIIQFQVNGRTVKQGIHKAVADAWLTPADRRAIYLEFEETKRLSNDEDAALRAVAEKHDLRWQTVFYVCEIVGTEGANQMTPAPTSHEQPVVTSTPRARDCGRAADRAWNGCVGANSRAVQAPATRGVANAREYYRSDEEFFAAVKQLSGLFISPLQFAPTIARIEHMDLFGEKIADGERYYKRECGGFGNVVKLSEKSMDRLCCAMLRGNEFLQSLADRINAEDDERVAEIFRMPADDRSSPRPKQAPENDGLTRARKGVAHVR
jgi:hypothetical protein